MTSQTAKTPTSGRQPLSGIRIIVGRARHQAGILSQDLRRLGAKVIEIPFIEIRSPRSYRPLDAALKNIDTYDWLILTSVNGVDAVWKRVEKLGFAQAALEHLKVAAIGPATRKAIERRGRKVNIVPEEYIAESVVKSLGEHVPGKRVLLARARVARDVIPNELRKLGAKVDVVEAYETVLPKASRTKLKAVLNGPRHPDVVTFTSSSSVRNFVALVGNKRRKRVGGPGGETDGLRFASIGPVTSATLRELGLPVDIEAAEYTIPGLIKAIVAAQ